MFAVDGLRSDEFGDDIAEAGAWLWSLGKGASDGDFSVCPELEVEVFHELVGVVRVGGAEDALFEDYGDPIYVFIDAVSVCNLVGVGRGCGDGGCGCRVEPGLSKEDNIKSEGGDGVPDLSGVFSERSGIEQEAVELSERSHGQLGGGSYMYGCSAVAREAAASARERSHCGAWRVGTAAVVAEWGSRALSSALV